MMNNYAKYEMDWESAFCTFSEIINILDREEKSSLGDEVMEVMGKIKEAIGYED